LDFDDLLLHTAAALEEHSAVAAEFRERYRCFVVDEYQDVTPLQQRVLDAWLGERDDLTVVGDANQTIYSFTGATPRYLLDFSRRFPDAAVVRLERDYRSTPEVVTLANRVIGAAKGRIAGTKLQLIGQRPSGVQPEFSEHDDESAEAGAVAARIKELLDRGTPAAEVAVLYRINAQSEVHEQALTELGIPYQVRGGDRFFERPEVRQAVLALRKAEQGRRTDDDGPDGEEAPEQLRVLVQAVLEPVGLTAQAPSGGAARDRWESLQALVALVDELLAVEPSATLSRLLTELASRADSRHPPVVQGVTLSSLHAAKGLEWDAVFLVGLVEGTLPIQHALGEGGAAEEAAVEEERRLLYVGVTRAREVLWLSWALARNAGGRKSRRRSRFVEGLIPADSPAARAATTARQTGGRSSRKRACCRVCGSQLIDTLAIKLGRCANCPCNLDDELLEALRVWRRERSQELKVPAYVVFTDATLTAIAEQQPRNDAGLVAIAGIGAAKLERFGAEVLALVRGDRAGQK
ncbi:MAG: ATP-dependent DNA helicase UvrD2, partial [Mycobacteriaceae bacterium]